jgi:hypothetical protein
MSQASCDRHDLRSLDPRLIANVARGVDAVVHPACGAITTARGLVTDRLTRFSDHLFRRTHKF